MVRRSGAQGAQEGEVAAALAQGGHQGEGEEGGGEQGHHHAHRPQHLVDPADDEEEPGHDLGGHDQLGLGSIG
jgi:hypothetical protein